MSDYSFNKKGSNKERENENRVNWQIKAFRVRVVREEEQLGIMSSDEARRIAQDDGLDLVEIAPQANPPVCRIMDYGKFKFEQKIKKKESDKKQRESQIQLKQLRLRPGIADHDTDTKINQAKKFLIEGCKVQFNLQFKGQREMSHKDQGFIVMKKVVESLNSISIVEKATRLEGNKITCCLSPKV